ncbi:hypothetical protein NNJEOMEG_02290 [Fundidesulfovibrio magnetotacticus]|uniref:Uncharacterized protein n=1 Tax=Fundidesulfovibrio magnetotacticus TaxID=2730080 RepID=A0A6V8M1W7_9BACT|nr:hypothetical protein [Fundidesulfovibrio magnetotacticus]GFK94445.1 hypothetical protein NNJEOMEG_02290 [Fundidesulfovibrio magnetotacticus]
MIALAYTERVIVPDAFPCLACRVHGPYCADHCARLDAWEARHETKTAQGPEHGEPEHGRR